MSYSKEWYKKEGKKNKKRYYQENREKILQKKKDYYKTNKKKIKMQHNEYAEKHRKKAREYGRRYRQKHPEQSGKYIRDIRLKALKIVSKGTLKCFRCSCDDIRILEINHTNGGGVKEFKEKGNYKFYRDITKGIRKTDDLNLLCKVCNQAHFVKLKYGIEYNVNLK
jgi:hypothetical protein